MLPAIIFRWVRKKSKNVITFYMEVAYFVLKHLYNFLVRSGLCVLHNVQCVLYFCTLENFMTHRWIFCRGPLNSKMFFVIPQWSTSGHFNSFNQRIQISCLNDYRFNNRTDDEIQSTLLVQDFRQQKKLATSNLAFKAFERFIGT